MTFRESLLPSLDWVRAIPGMLGLRLFRASVRVTSWSGSRIGIGTKTILSERVLTVGHGTQNVKVRQLTQKDVIASGGKYTTQDFKIGPMTPEFLGGGVPVEWLDPVQRPEAVEIIYLIEGPGLPAGGGRYQRIEDETTRSFHSNVIVRHTGQQ